MSEDQLPGPSEFEHLVRADRLPAKPIVLTANETERSALAERFGLPAISTLEANVALEPDGPAIKAKGRVTASFEQLCAVTQEPFVNSLDEQVDLIFVPETADHGPVSDEEIELEETDLDTIEFEGQSIDIGEAAAQTLGLAIDPYAEGPGADAARDQAGILSDDKEQPSGPLAEALAALKKD